MALERGPSLTEQAAERNNEIRTAELPQMEPSPGKPGE